MKFDYLGNKASVLDILTETEAIPPGWLEQAIPEVRTLLDLAFSRGENPPVIRRNACTGFSCNAGVWHYWV